MRKIITLFLLFVSACFAGCTTQLTASQDSTSDLTTESSLSTKPLPFYVPGSIHLESKEDIAGDFLFKPTKRRVYYSIPWQLLELGPEGTYAKLFEKNKTPNVERKEMAIVTLVKYCNISRDEFDIAIEELENQYVSWGEDMTQEQYELPNADIIYTFDNEIINDYYRRE